MRSATKLEQQVACLLPEGDYSQAGMRSATLKACVACSAQIHFALSARKIGTQADTHFDAAERYKAVCEGKIPLNPVQLHVHHVDTMT